MYTINGVKTDDEEQWEKHKAQIDTLRKLLIGFDWFYAYSDDHRVWQAGEKRKAEINGMVMSIGEDGKRLYNAYHDTVYNPATGFSFV